MDVRGVIYWGSDDGHNLTDGFVWFGFREGSYPIRLMTDPSARG